LESSIRRGRHHPRGRGHAWQGDGVLGRERASGGSRLNRAVEELCGVLEPEDLLDRVVERQPRLSLALTGTLDRFDYRVVADHDARLHDARHQPVEIREFREHGEVFDGAWEVAAPAVERDRLGCQRRVEGEAGDTKPWRTVHGRNVRRVARICVQAYINAGQGPPQVWRWGG